MVYYKQNCIQNAKMYTKKEEDKQMKLGFIGTGNMATAMMGGIIENHIAAPEEIIGADPICAGA